MGKALYRRYRSTSFDEVLGQEHITTALKNSLKNGTFAHAYLLTGPRGVGKTSIARILAYAVNDLPYDESASQLDIIEIDAASNRRIDEIRSLREKVHIAPATAKYKVYIIDEVHMLTREAFNALLKTLEEPPEHAIFILATTDLHKVPDTIISRCITFNFRPIENSILAEHLKNIAKLEKINIEDEALNLLALHGSGSFRDSISLLDQVKNTGNEIKKEDIELVVGLAPSNIIDDLINAVKDHKAGEMNATLEEAYKKGASVLNLTKQLAAKIRQGLMDGKPLFPAMESTEILKSLLDVPAARNQRASLELILLNQLFKDFQSPANSKPETDVREIKATLEIKPVESSEKSKTRHIIKPSVSKTSDKQSPDETDNDIEIWDTVLAKLKKQNNTLYGIARMAKADLQDNTLVLSFKFPFHFKQVNSPKNKSLITIIIGELGHKNIQLDIKLLDGKAPPMSQSLPKNTNQDDKSLEDITNIFGSGEMLES
jgi:DNA polymerase III subunit gamma/tau